jgi:UDP-glucose-4-epimerase GalE
MPEHVRIGGVEDVALCGGTGVLSSHCAIVTAPLPCRKAATLPGMQPQHVLVTGGAGFIGSHAALALAEAGHRVTLVDDLSRGHRAAAEAVVASSPKGAARFEHCSIADRERLAGVMRSGGVTAVMHFAALTYVGESVERPVEYWSNNLAGSLALLQAMDEAGVRRIVFSSTAATYGEPPPELIPIREDCPQRPINPYGASKLAFEHVLADRLVAAHAAGTPFSFAALRYFNVSGCDPRGRLGEDHRPETHLIPLCIQALLGRRAALTVYGDDYPTRDGTCIRDYVDVDDLVDAHVRALAALPESGSMRFNVGTGTGFSVREVLDACARVAGKPVPHTVGARRPGDPASLVADGRAIAAALGWSARTGLEDSVERALRWMSDHPRGWG